MKFLILSLALIAGVMADVSELAGYGYQGPAVEHGSHDLSGSIAAAPSNSYLPPVAAPSAPVANFPQAPAPVVSSSLSSPIAAPAPAHIHAPAPAPAHVHASAPAPAHVHAPAPAPAHVHAPAPAPAHVHAPAPAPTHVHAPAPAPAHVHAPAPAPAHVHAPAPAPAHVHVPEPAPVQASAPAPVHAPSNDYLPPAAISAANLGPQIGSDDGATEVGSDGYRYKTHRRVVYRRRF